MFAPDRNTALRARILDEFPLLYTRRVNIPVYMSYISCPVAAGKLYTRPSRFFTLDLSCNDYANAEFLVSCRTVGRSMCRHKTQDEQRSPPSVRYTPGSTYLLVSQYRQAVLLVGHGSFRRPDLFIPGTEGPEHVGCTRCVLFTALC